MPQTINTVDSGRVLNITSIGSEAVNQKHSHAVVIQYSAATKAFAKCRRATVVPTMLP